MAVAVSEHRSGNVSTPHRVILKRNQSGKEGVAERDILLQSFLQIVCETKAIDKQLYTFEIQFQWEDYTFHLVSAVNAI